MWVLACSRSARICPFHPIAKITLFTGCPCHMCAMPQVFNNTQKNGVKDFHRSINSGIKPCRLLKSDSNCVIRREVLTVQLQKWIINLTFMLLHPGEQFALDINRSPSRVFLAQCSCSLYQVINPILGVSIFDTSFSLLVFHILGNTQTGQLDLVLNLQDGLFCRSSTARLDILF